MFQNARLKLTLWYLFIIMLISVSFSMAIYTMISSEITRLASVQRVRIERRLHDSNFLPPELQDQLPGPILSITDPDLLNETRNRIIMILVVINGSILVLSGGFGYLLAGRTLKPIQEMHEEQNQFISDSSHELRTPLTALKSTMEVSLRDKKLTISEAREVLRDSIHDVDKLKELTDGLLQLTKFENFSKNNKFEIISLLQVTREAVTKVVPLAKNKKLILTNKTVDLDIWGDKYSLVDLFVILLDNAIKYSPENTEITLSSKRTDGTVKVSVADQGVGIESKDLPHIFDRFYRADSARSRSETGGYGLGLPIAKQIAGAHHGNISVESKINKGSVFTVQLPVKKRSR